MTEDYLAALRALPLPERTPDGIVVPAGWLEARYPLRPEVIKQVGDAMLENWLDEIENKVIAALGVVGIRVAGERHYYRMGRHD